jgi:hypothetical protein
MMPVALGLGEGGEFYQPLAVSIIGGTITSTLLTLLVVPSFYDSIESASERMRAKIQARGQRYHESLALVVTMLEALMALLLLRFVLRSLLGGWMWMRRRANAKGCVAGFSLGLPTL